MYGLLRVDKAMDVTFGQRLPEAAEVALHVWRLLSTFQVLYVFALMWLLPEFVMQMTGYAMFEYRGEFGASTALVFFCSSFDYFLTISTVIRVPM